MIRLFVSLNIPNEIINQIQQIKESIFPNFNELKWEENSKLHLTLKFIGEVNESLVKLIQQELEFLEAYNRLKCSTTKFGCFYNQNNEPKILWLGLKFDEHIFSIVEQLNERLVKFSIAKENRKFKPHLTLLRIKKHIPKEIISKFINTEPKILTFDCSESSLMKSELLKHGSVYSEIKKYKLK